MLLFGSAPSSCLVEDVSGTGPVEASRGGRPHTTCKARLYQARQRKLYKHYDGCAAHALQARNFAEGDEERKMVTPMKMSA